MDIFCLSWRCEMGTVAKGLKEQVGIRERGWNWTKGKFKLWMFHWNISGEDCELYIRCFESLKFLEKKSNFNFVSNIPRTFYITLDIQSLPKCVQEIQWRKSTKQHLITEWLISIFAPKSAVSLELIMVERAIFALPCCLQDDGTLFFF